VAAGLAAAAGEHYPLAHLTLLQNVLQPSLQESRTRAKWAQVKHSAANKRARRAGDARAARFASGMKGRAEIRRGRKNQGSV